MNFNSGSYSNTSPYPTGASSLRGGSTSLYSSQGSNVNMAAAAAAAAAATGVAVPARAPIYTASPASAPSSSAHASPASHQGSTASPLTAFAGPGTSSSAAGGLLYTSTAAAPSASSASPTAVFSMGPGATAFGGLPPQRGGVPAVMTNPASHASFPAQPQAFAMAAGPTPTMAAYGPAPASSNPATNINLGSKLFVGQVPAVCTEEQLRPLFAQFGTLLEVKIMRESNGRSRGSAWVRYESEDAARRAIAALNEQHVVPPQTNPLRVQFAAPSHPRNPPMMTLQPLAQQPQPQLASMPGSAFGTALLASSQQAQQQQQQMATNRFNGPSYATGTPMTYTTTTTTATAPNTAAGAAPSANAYVQATPYRATSLFPYGGTSADAGVGQNRSDPTYTVGRPSMQPSAPQPQQPFVGKVDYMRATATQPGSTGASSGNSVLFTATYARSGPTSQSPQQQQQQQQQYVPSPPQQQQMVYTASGPMSAGVMYTAEGFTLPNSINASGQQQQQQQQQQWRH